MKPEWMAFGLNTLIFSIYLWQGREPGKCLYWLGAAILAAGLIKMQG